MAIPVTIISKEIAQPKSLKHKGTVKEEVKDEKRDLTLGWQLSMNEEEITQVPSIELTRLSGTIALKSSPIIHECVLNCNPPSEWTFLSADLGQ